MLQHVVKHTSERARRDLRKRSKNPDEWMPFDLCEMKDIVDVLYLIGVYCCQHESLLANLGFDSREDRNTDDKSAPFR